MASITETSIRRPVATAMLYAIIVTVGIVGFLYLPVDLLPAIEFPRLSVNVTYPNVGPEEMETIVTDPLENALSGIPNLERMTSFSQEGRSRVSLEFGRQVSLDEAANDVRSALDRLRDDFPLEADAPTIWKFDPDAQDIVTLAVTSSRDLEHDDPAARGRDRPAFRADSRRRRDHGGRRRLPRDPGAAGPRSPEGRRFVGQRRAGRADPRERAVAGRQRQGRRAGPLRAHARRIPSLAEIGATVVEMREKEPVRVRDVADRRRLRGRHEPRRGQRRPVVRLQIQKQSGANTVEVAALVRDEVERVNRERSDLRLSVLSDQSDFIRQSIDNVRSSAIYGGLLAIAILYLFLRNHRRRSSSRWPFRCRSSPPSGCSTSPGSP